MVKWDPGPKKLEKGSPNTQTKLTLFQEKLCFFSVDFSLILCSVLGRPFYNFDGQSARNDGPLGTLFTHFAGKLERRNLWFRLHQTPLFMVSRGRVWECWASFFKWFSELDPGMYFFDFLWDLGSNREPKLSLLNTISAINWRSIFWWILEGSGGLTPCWNGSPGRLFELLS